MPVTKQLNQKRTFLYQKLEYQKSLGYQDIKNIDEQTDL